MACCFFVIFVLGKLINTCEALDLDIGVKIADSTEALREETGGGPTSQPEFDASSLTTLSITGMTCAACVGTLEKALLGVNGVDRVKVSLVLEEAMIIHKTTKINSDALIEVVENCGYEAEPGKRSSYQRLEVLRRAQELQVLRDSLMGIPKWAALLFILETLGKKAMGSGSLIGGLLATVTAACSLALVLKIQYDHGMWVHQNTWHLLLKTKANMNTLVSASITWGIFLSALNPFIFGLRDARSYLLTCTGLLMVITVGRYLEALTRREASSGLVSLYSLQARCAYAKLAKDHELIPTSMVQISDDILIDPFVIIPCDCYVLAGSSQVDESIVTGENQPISKTVGDFLLAGTRNGSGTLTAIVRKQSDESSITKLVNSVVEATANKASVQRRIDWITHYFAIGIISLAVIYGLATMVWMNPRISLSIRINYASEKCMAILTAACPCALGLATPSAIMAGIDVAWRQGILIVQGARTMEVLNSISHIVMDKTGTLTQGRLEVTAFEIMAYWDDHWKEFCLLVCAGEERGASIHPAGSAVFKRVLSEIGPLWREFLDGGRTINLTEMPGRGIACETDLGDGKLWNTVIGNLDHLKSNGVDCSEVNNVSGVKNGTKVYVGIDGLYAGMIHLEDPVKIDAKDTIDQLKQSGYNIQMLTGDLLGEAERVSQQLAIPVLGARALPGTKLDFISSLQKDGSKIAMVGDGINDAPSLAAADVGIMMTHNQACMTTGGEVLVLNSSLTSLLRLFHISQQTMKQVQNNVTWAFIYNLCALSLAMGILKPWGVNITPSVAASMMACSSLGISLYSLHFRRRLLEQCKLLG